MLYYTHYTEGKKVIAVVGSIDFDNVKNKLENTLGQLENNNIKNSEITKPELQSAKRFDVIKEDANQAQILQGWIIPNF